MFVSCHSSFPWIVSWQKKEKRKKKNIQNNSKKIIARLKCHVDVEQLDIHKYADIIFI